MFAFVIKIVKLEFSQGYQSIKNLDLGTSYEHQSLGDRWPLTLPSFCLIHFRIPPDLADFNLSTLHIQMRRNF